MKFLGIIPARYASTRFPAKPLAMLGGKTVIQRVYEQVAGILDDAYVATDDERIEAAVKAFGGKVVMTSIDHKSGTDRCYEACTKIGGDFDVVVNIQGDEPFIQPSQLNAVKACFEDPTTQIATLVKPFTADEPFAVLENVNSPKVVLNKNWNALYFSRSIIPFQRNADKEDWLKGHTYYKHIGLYAYRTEVLKEITALPQSSLELAESLEQLRWLENGYKIKVGISDVETIGIDTPEDLARAEAFLKNMEKGLIEVAPLAYMRGRTLDNAYIVLDEAQNTTPAQMKMFLTRIGFGSKAIITGDLSQKDLPKDAQSGLEVALRVRHNIDERSVIRFTSEDVVRHPLVQRIVNAYEEYENRHSRDKKQTQNKH